MRPFTQLCELEFCLRPRWSCSSCALLDTVKCHIRYAGIGEVMPIFAPCTPTRARAPGSPSDRCASRLATARPQLVEIGIEGIELGSEIDRIRTRLARDNEKEAARLALRRQMRAAQRMATP